MLLCGLLSGACIISAPSSLAGCCCQRLTLHCPACRGCSTAGVLVMESLEHAQKRGATIIAEYLGGKCWTQRTVTS